MAPHRRCRFARTLLCAALASCAAPRSAPGPGLVAVGARQLWLDCRGRGSPTLVLEAGHTESAETWAAVQLEVAAFTRVCSYDRAGRGHSPRAPDSVRRGSDVVADLAELLSAAGESPPLILVGHSLGGAFARLYVVAHPTSVAGLLLVDAVHEGEFARIDALLTPEQRRAGAGMKPMSPEGFDIEAIFGEVRTAAAKTVSVPVTVVARGRPLGANEFPPDWSLAQRAERDTLRQVLQAELAHSFPQGRLVVAENSGHFIHHDEPALLVAEIRRLVDAWRRSHGAT